MDSNVKLVLSMQDVSHVLQCIVQQPYAQVADLVARIKQQIEVHAAEQRSIGQGVQAGAQTAAPNGETH